MGEATTETKGENVESDKKITDANSEVQTPIKKFLQKNDILLMLYPKDRDGDFSSSIAPEDEIAVYKLLKNKNNQNKKNLLLFLDTSGGNVYSAVKIMDTLRTKYSEITIAIPQEAKSSGTMMCCGADKLIMSSISELGPLDKPMIHPENESARISALDIVKSIDGMLDTAEEREKQFAIELRKETGMPVKACLELASESISKLISPMLCREDVKIYNQAKRLLAIAEQYAEELLTKHMLRYIKDDKWRTKIAKMIIRRLVWYYPDHGFAIRRDELREWLFVVEDSEKLNYWDEIWSEFEQNIGSNKGKIIKFYEATS